MQEVFCNISGIGGDADRNPRDGGANGLGDMGGDGTGDRDNELKVPLEDSNKNQGK